MKIYLIMDIENPSPLKAPIVCCRTLECAEEFINAHESPDSLFIKPIELIE